MIRKIILFITLAFSVLWFAGAYLIKNRVALIIQQLETDNLKISYDKLTISGFPKIWKIEIIGPHIKLIERTSAYDIHVQKLQCSLDSSFKEVKLLFGHDLQYNQSIKDKIRKYTIHATDNIILSFKFDQPLYQLSNYEQLQSYLKSFNTNNKLLIIRDDTHHIFDIKELVISVIHNFAIDIEGIVLSLKATYDKVDDKISGTSAPLINFDAIFKTRKTVNSDAMHNNTMFVANDLQVIFDDAKLRLQGSVNLTKDQLPNGRIFVNLNNYNSIIDSLVPDSLIMSRAALKTLIAKITDHNINIDRDDLDKVFGAQDDVQFDIVLSEKGVNIGSINLLEFKLNDD